MFLKILTVLVYPVCLHLLFSDYIGHTWLHQSKSISYLLALQSKTGANQVMCITVGTLQSSTAAPGEKGGLKVSKSAIHILLYQTLSLSLLSHVCVNVAVCLCVRLLHLCFFFGSIGPTWLHQSKSISYLLVTPASSC